VNDKTAQNTTTEEPEKLDLRSHVIAEDKQADLLRLFPEIRTEDGKVDFDKLKLVLGETVDVGRERYGMNWPGKADCFKTIQQPSLGTLLPRRDESVNFDTTENLIIEGDNLEVLKLLQKSYLGKVKMIYIDPPYNTGNDFIYPDNYAESLQTYLQYTGQVDDEGRKFSTNTEADGRFHSKWLNMMYPRLYLARNLLREDGVIFVSIGPEEVASLRLIMNDLFGEENMLEILTRVAKLTSNKGTHFSPACDYVLAYARDVNALPEFTDTAAQSDEDYLALFRFNDERGKYNEVSLYMPSLDLRPNQRYYITCPDGSKVIPPPGKVFRWTRETFDRNRDDNRVIFKQTKTSPLLNEAGERANWNIYTKIYLQERLEKGLRPSTLLDSKSFTNSTASKELIRLGIDFPFSKPFELVAHLASICGVSDGDVVLDFFAGSGSTGQAIFESNRADGLRRYFILVQLPEVMELSKFATIADVTKERLRRVLKKLYDPQDGQISMENSSLAGFRVFQLAESNLKTWMASADSTSASMIAKQLDLHVENVRPERTSEDILYEFLLKSGFPLATNVQALSLQNKTVYSVADGAMLICLDLNLTHELIRAMADRDPKPERIVCLDAGFAGNDQLKTNAVQTMKARGVTSFRTV